MIYKDELGVTGEWYASVRYIDFYGHRHTEKKYGFRSFSEAFRWEAAFHLRRLSWVPETVLFDSLLLRYKAIFQPKYIDGKIGRYFSGVALSRITVEVLEDFWASLIEHRFSKGKKQLSQAACNIIMQQLYVILECAVYCCNQEHRPAEREDVLDFDMDDIEQFSAPVWTREQFISVTEILRGNLPIYLASSLMFWLHIPPADVRGLRVGDFDAESRILTVRVKRSRAVTGETADEGVVEGRTDYITTYVTLPESISNTLSLYIKANQLTEFKALLPISNDILNIRLAFGAEGAGVPYTNHAGLFASGLYSGGHGEATDIPEPPERDMLLERRSSNLYKTADELRILFPPLTGDAYWEKNGHWLQTVMDDCMVELRDLWKEKI